MATIENFDFKIPYENIYKLNTVFNIRDINTPIGEPDVDYESSNPPRFFLYLVDSFNMEDIRDVTTLDNFVNDNQGSLVPIEYYNIPEVYLENGEMVNQIGFSIIVTGYGTDDPEITNNSSVTIHLENTVGIHGFFIVYDMEPESNDSTKHILAVCRGKSRFSVPRGDFSISFNEKNLWTEAETVCQG